MNIIERIKAKKLKLEQEKRISKAIKDGKNVFGEGDYILYDFNNDGEIEILITLGPVSELSHKKQLERLRQLWKIRIKNVRIVERRAFQLDDIRGEVNLSGVRRILNGIPQEVIEEVDREIYGNGLTLSQAK